MLLLLSYSFLYIQVLILYNLVNWQLKECKAIRDFIDQHYKNRQKTEATNPLKVEMIGQDRKNANYYYVGSEYPLNLYLRARYLLTKDYHILCQMLLGSTEKDIQGLAHLQLSKTLNGNR